jgi:hypothetical protein
MKIQLIIPAMISINITSSLLDDSKIYGLNEMGDYYVENVNNEFSVIIDHDKFCFKIFENGVLIFRYTYELSDDTNYLEILKSKEEKTNEILSRDGAVIKFIKYFDSYISSCFPKQEKAFFYNGKYISYCLATYFISKSNIETGYALALKRFVKTEEISLHNEQSLKVVNINEKIMMLLTWGARVFMGEDSFAQSLYEDYIAFESEAQYLWFIVTSLDKRIDKYMMNETDRPVDISTLLNYSYGILYRKSKFDTVKSSRVHRYEVEILNNIIEASKIDSLFKNLEMKITILKEKSILVEEKIEKKNRKFTNALLSIISLLSAISTIYGFISVFQEDNKKIIYVIVTIFALVLFFSAKLIQIAGRKRTRKSDKLNKKKHLN